MYQSQKTTTVPVPLCSGAKKENLSKTDYDSLPGEHVLRLNFWHLLQKKTHYYELHHDFLNFKKSCLLTEIMLRKEEEHFHLNIK